MEERIIFAVSSKPCLFDTTADSYRDINTKNATWRQVSTIVGLPEEDCRRRWRGLRDRYQRERRAEKDKRSGSSASGHQPSATFFLFWIHLLCLGQRVAILQPDPLLRHPQVLSPLVHQDPQRHLQMRPSPPPVE
ncbi:unnamed protein product [Oncorhynchus mykiss]|uniref:MADF domain-containing protein n=1 Tax=Oncorhynchus mykiss TaxID=8022 RepID=A0A060WNW9_ONCMY|nr:unnamed protein product [Oncorhynchus mykiss]